MLRRTLVPLFAVALSLAAGRAEAVTIRDVIELSKAGLSDSVLLALIDVEQSVFSIDTATLKQLKNAGVSDAVIVAMIRSGRTPPPAIEPVVVPEPIPQEPPAPREPEVIEYRQPPAPAPIAYPVPYAVPVFVPVPTRRSFNHDTVSATIQTDVGLVKAQVPVPPNCLKAEPVFWGFGGKLRPDSWQPAPTIVCR